MTAKERPILFSGAMVRAILDGSKTQTRRVAKVDESRLVDLPGMSLALVELDVARGQARAALAAHPQAVQESNT